MTSIMDKFYNNLKRIYNSEKTNIEKSRLAVKTINEFLYTTYDELGKVIVFDESYYILLKAFKAHVY